MLIREPMVLDTLDASKQREVKVTRVSGVMQGALFTVPRLDHFVPAEHARRSMRLLANEVLSRSTGLSNSLMISVAPEPERRTAPARRRRWR